MDAELKTKWVDALRSGEFLQGTGKLHDPKSDSYCCLGVLCKIAGASFEPATIEVENDDGAVERHLDHVPVLGGEVLSNRDEEELSSDASEKFGIKEVQHILIGKNDGNYLKDPTHPRFEHEHSFAEIADYIERHL